MEPLAPNGARRRAPLRRGSGARRAERRGATGARSLALALVALAASVPSARAHRGSTKLLVVERTDEGAIVDVELETVDVAVELGLGEEAPISAVLRRDAAIRAWLEQGITLRARGGACTTRASAPRLREREDGPRIAVTIEARCPAPRERVTLRDDTIFGSDPQHEAFVRLRWTDEGDAHVLRRGRQTVELGEPPTVLALIGRFLHEGALHLVTGYDHLLFLLSLVLTAGGLAAREGMRVAGRDVAWLVTAFTVGHSVTLIAAALGVVVLPSKLVESVIAASIVLVALLNVWRPRARRSMPWLAFGFGLVHGFGFSGVLAELGLPAQARVLSLVAFNVGIELAQLVFVGVLLYPLAWTAKFEGYERWIVRGGSIVIAMLATFWLVERVSA